MEKQLPKEGELEPSTQVILLPAEIWETAADANSVMRATEHKGSGLIGVKTFDYSGAAYTSFGVMWGPIGTKQRPVVWAHRLMPESQYQGPTTTVYHDEAAIAAGTRERGDLAGLLVSVNGKRMVCGSKLEFHMDLPATPPVPLAEAQLYDERNRHQGWRALWCRGNLPEWFLLRGHPVARYLNQRGEVTMVVFWKTGGEWREVGLCDDGWQLDPPDTPVQHVAEAGQLALF